MGKIGSLPKECPPWKKEFRKKCRTPPEKRGNASRRPQGLEPGRKIWHNEKNRPGPTAPAEMDIAHETDLYRHPGPCGCRKNNLIRSPAVPRRGHPPPGPGGPSGRFFGYRRHGAPAGHHHFLQAGGAGTGRYPGDAAGHPRPCGFFRRNGADPSGAGLRRAGDLRHRRRPGPHPDAVGPAGAVSGPHLPLY